MKALASQLVTDKSKWRPSHLNLHPTRANEASATQLVSALYVHSGYAELTIAECFYTYMYWFQIKYGRRTKYLTCYRGGEGGHRTCYRYPQERSAGDTNIWSSNDHFVQKATSSMRYNHRLRCYDRLQGYPPGIGVSRTYCNALHFCAPSNTWKMFPK